MKNLLNNRAFKSALAITGKQILLILVALLMASFFLGISGYDPLAIIKGIGQGVTKDLSGTIRWSIPLILAGLAVSIAFRTKVFNLGMDGQLYMGAAAATAVALYSNITNSLLMLVLVFIAAALAGAAFAWIPAQIKVLWQTDEVVSTLLLNFVAVLFIEFLVLGPMKMTDSVVNMNASDIIPEVAWLPRLAYLGASAANVGIYLSIVIALILAFIIYKTKFGHDIKIVGTNPLLAKYSGIKANYTILSVMLISGAISGIIGAIEVTAVQHRLLDGFNPNLGFEGIVVSLLANNNPIGVIFSGLFFGALKNGGMNMERSTDVPSAMGDVVQAIIILIISAQFTMPYIRRWYQNYKSTQNQRKTLRNKGGGI